MSTNSTTPAIDPDSDYAKENNLARILAPLIVFHVIALAFVGMRSYVRWAMTNTYGKDDTLMIAGAIFTLGGMITFIAQSWYGLGRHQDIIAHDDMVQFLTWDFAQTIVAHTTGFTLVKISICVSLLRLSQSRLFFWIIWPVIVVFMISAITAYFAFFLRCIPLRAVFDHTIDAYCYPVEQFVQMALANTGLNISTDVLCATLPIPIIWKLQMKLRTRLYLILIFSMGYLAVAMGILKAVYQINFSKSPDLTIEYNISFWGFLQINFGIIAACSPVLKPLIGGFLRLHAETHEPGYPSRPRTGGTSGAKSLSRGLRTIGGGFMTRSGAEGPPPRGRGPYPNHDPEAATESEEIIELTGKVLGDGGDYHASIRGGGRYGRSTATSSGDRADDEHQSRTGSEELILGSGPEGIVMTTEVKVTDE